MKRSLILCFALLTNLGSTFAQKAVITESHLSSEAIAKEEYKINVYVNMEITGAIDKDLKVVVYFYAKNGNPLMDNNNYYRTSEGQVSTSVNIKPIYESTVYTNLKVSIPTIELDIISKAYKYIDINTILQYEIDVFYEDRSIIDVNHSNTFNFWYIKNRCSQCNGLGTIWAGGSSFFCGNCGGKGYQFHYDAFSLPASKKNSTEKIGLGEPIPLPNTLRQRSNRDIKSTTSRDCSVCNGTGTVVRNITTSQYGVKNEAKVKCSECGIMYYPSLGHSHISCSSCGGTGKAR